MMRIFGLPKVKAIPRPKNVKADVRFRGDPLDHPALRRLGPRELADLPVPRHRLSEAASQ